MTGHHLVAETKAGRVRGVAANGIAIFRGIPYAAPVSGSHRFRPPRPPEPWPGVLPAVAYGPSAPQPPRPPAPFDSPSLPQSEDCLVLNVWTSGGGKKPVLVWIHGGGFSTGSGSGAWVDGTRIAATEQAVVVTLNHRLGLLGFLDLSSCSAGYGLSGHSSMLDLIAALEWVRDNISGFGGDPSRVTIFGESGGGAKVLALAAMPSARGLFHRAIVQSGVFLNGPGELLQTSERATQITERVVAAAGGPARLLAAPLEQLLDIQCEVERDHRPGSGGLMPFAPLVDGTVIPDHPKVLARRGELADVPFIIGSNRDEATLFAWASNPAFREQGRSWEPTDEWLVAALRGYAGDRVSDILRTYRELRPGAANAQLYFAVASDNMRAGAIRMAEALIAGHRPNVRMYLFSWQSAARDGSLGASHTFEIPFVFGNAVEVFNQPADPAVSRLNREMTAAWISFAASSRPEVPGVGRWPEYSADSRATMEFGHLTALASDPHRAERESWAQA